MDRLPAVLPRCGPSPDALSWSASVRNSSREKDAHTLSSPRTPCPELSPEIWSSGLVECTLSGKTRLVQGGGETPSFTFFYFRDLKK